MYISYNQGYVTSNFLRRSQDRYFNFNTATNNETVEKNQQQQLVEKVQNS